jgi:hypothetical protein
MTRLLRPVAVFALLAGLAAPSWSQESKKSQNANDASFGPVAEEPVDDSGSPWYGYCAFFALAGLTLFAVCRSSRR